MLQAVVAYGIVACAAAFVVWRILLPARARLALRRLAGVAPADCAAGGDEGGCPGGCAGCSSAKPAKRLM